MFHTIIEDASVKDLSDKAGQWPEVAQHYINVKAGVQQMSKEYKYKLYLFLQMEFGG